MKTLLLYKDWTLVVCLPYYNILLSESLVVFSEITTEMWFSFLASFSANRSRQKIRLSTDQQTAISGSALLFPRSLSPSFLSGFSTTETLLQRLSGLQPARSYLDTRLSPPHSQSRLHFRPPHHEVSFL